MSNIHAFMQQEYNRGYRNGYADAMNCHTMYQQGMKYAIECIKSHLCVKDDDYDKPIISPKYLNDYLDLMIVDGFEKLEEQNDD